MRHIVVIGAGLAGHSVSAALRRNGFTGRLTLVGEEPHPPYNRPPLSKQVLLGSMAPHHVFFPCDDLDLDVKFGTSAIALDSERQIVRLSSSQELTYDAVVVATGRRARALPGLPDLAGLHTLRTLNDTVVLRRAVRGASAVAIVGAGFIGCEVAATLRNLGVKEVTVIDIAPYPMPVLGPEAGRWARRLHESRGVRFCLEAAVAAFEGGDRVEALRLSNGERISADVVLLAVGSQPNTEWLASSGIALFDGAVDCDEHCFARGHDDIIAVGDVAAYPYPMAGRPLCVEHWATARDMAETAAINLLPAAGARQLHRAVPTFWSDQYDVKVKSAGLLQLADQHRVVHEDGNRPSLVVEALRAGELVGAIAFNRNRTIIEYRRRLAGQAVAGDRAAAHPVAG